MVTPANSETSSSQHVKKHKMKIYYRSPGFGDPWSAGQARPGLARTSSVGRGLLRSRTILTERFQALMAASRAQPAAAMAGASQSRGSGRIGQ